MVCNRCIEAVQEEFNNLNLNISKISLGHVLLASDIDSRQLNDLASRLEARGFEILKDKNSQLIEQIKNLVIDQIYSETNLNINYSDYLEKNIGKDYSGLSSLFSSVEGITIERFVILQKIERIKELLTYDELTLSEISYRLGYSSVQHLSSQFKKNTGMTPSEFKKTFPNNRKPIDHAV